MTNPADRAPAEGGRDELDPTVADPGDDDPEREGGLIANVGEDEGSAPTG